MAYEQRDNSGSIFSNKRKTRESDPNLAGSIMVDGKEYWLNGWTKVKSDGEKWISLSVRPKEPKPQQAQAPAAPQIIDEEIPF